MEVEENEVTGLSVDFLPLAVLLPGLLGPSLGYIRYCFSMAPFFLCGLPASLVYGIF